MTDYNEAWEKVLYDSSFPWWEWDIVRNTVKYNDLKAVMLGYHPEHFREKGYQAFTELVHPDDYEETMEAMRAVLRKETKLYQTDYRIRTVKGDYLWFMDRGIITRSDGNGRPLRIRGIVIDLGKETERGSDVNALMTVIRNSATAAKGEYSFITVCSLCLKVKKADKEWMYLPEGLSELIGEKVSHGICPDCMKKLYPEYAGEVLSRIAREKLHDRR
ncbi:MAG: PAS domain-containing protein [Candidatus Marinimicrobia bacterium]|nr:PAS domain-containing protein [Candidatus Neomarinimicrobiota bacterium]